MSLLGKILLVVNLLAAGGLVYLTAQDYAKRQQLNAALVEHRLLIDGLPVDPSPGEATDDEVPLAVQIGPGVSVSTVRKKSLEKYFGGQAVASQVEAVKAVKDKILNDTSALNTNAEKLGFLCGSAGATGAVTPGVLMNLADSYEERIRIRELALTKEPARQSAAYEEARRRLERKFDAVLKAPEPRAAQADADKVLELKGRAADKAAAEELRAMETEGLPAVTRDDADRRVRIARLLAFSAPQTAAARDAQARAARVVGLKVYALAVADQTVRLQEMTVRNLRDIELDQQTFSDEYELLKRLAQELDQILFQQQRVVKGLRQQAERDTEAVNIRSNQSAALKADLAKVTEAVADLLRRQAEAEARLLAVQQQVGETLVNNFGLEEKLLKAEQHGK
jgi:hypothetical protein